ncbi:MAG TPA: hypothetical protein VK501_09215 [Baekduia sp.]|uniref:hypothetical protein n=1 Tax=Baekduia sp. TaxID=2600305 RepID=UPI002C671723|nr:hypothetical protein [Baekduia sp.]HMJ34087.1 hypothetical protein [Baekduia sp.]
MPSDRNEEAESGAGQIRYLVAFLIVGGGLMKIAQALHLPEWATATLVLPPLIAVMFWVHSVNVRRTQDAIYEDYAVRRRQKEILGGRYAQEQRALGRDAREASSPAPPRPESKSVSEAVDRIEEQVRRALDGPR